jgi:hypothetical protein
MERAMNLDNLTPEQQEKAKACKTPEEFLEMIREEGIELTDEQLESISGGVSWYGCTQDECTHNEVGRYCIVF